MKRIINVVNYIFLVLICSVLFVICQSYVVLVILIFLLSLGVISILLVKYVANRVEVSVEMAEGMVDRNQEFPIVFRINNPTIIPVVDLNIICSYSNNFYDFEEKIAISVPGYARGEQVVKLPVKSEYVGVVNVNVKEVVVWDLLHVWNQIKTVDVHKWLVLYPIIKDSVSLDLNRYVCGNDDTEESIKIGNDFSEVQNIREYIPGDSLRDIHWKLSVKKDELMVKEHTTMSSRQMSIVIELFEDGNYSLDAIVDLAYSLCMNIIREGVPYTIFYWSEKSGEIKEKIVLNKEEVVDCFCEIFHEKSYNQKNKAREGFNYLSHHVEYVLWVHGDGGNQEETIFSYKDKAFVSYSEVM